MFPFVSPLLCFLVPFFSSLYLFSYVHLVLLFSSLNLSFPCFCRILPIYLRSFFLLPSDFLPLLPLLHFLPLLSSSFTVSLPFPYCIYPSLFVFFFSISFPCFFLSLFFIFPSFLFLNLFFRIFPQISTPLPNCFLSYPSSFLLSPFSYFPPFYELSYFSLPPLFPVLCYPHLFLFFIYSLNLFLCPYVILSSSLRLFRPTFPLLPPVSSVSSLPSFPDLKQGETASLFKVSARLNSADSWRAEVLLQGQLDYEKRNLHPIQVCAKVSVLLCLCLGDEGVM